MNALACCRHHVVKTTVPVCLECYQDLFAVARRMREVLNECYCSCDCRDDVDGYTPDPSCKRHPAMDAFDALVGREK